MPQGPTHKTARLAASLLARGEDKKKRKLEELARELRDLRLKA